MTSFQAIPRRVLVDSSAYFAIANTHDHDHNAVASALHRLTRTGTRLFTTNFVLAETHALLVNRINRQVAALMLNQIDQSELTTVVRVSFRDEQCARQILATYTDKDFSLTDAISFAVMERIRIGHALALDQHFAQFGWQDIVRPFN